MALLGWLEVLLDGVVAQMDRANVQRGMERKNNDSMIDKSKRAMVIKQDHMIDVHSSSRTLVSLSLTLSPADLSKVWVEYGWVENRR